MSKMLKVAACLLALFAAVPAHAVSPVEYSNAWVRASESGSDTVAYMNVRSDVPVTLIRVSSPLATSGALHQMKMEDGVMKMREADKLFLPAGVIANFEPRTEYHLMLYGIKREFKDRDRIPVILTFQNAKGRKFKVNVDAEARFLPLAHRQDMQKDPKMEAMPGMHPMPEGHAAPQAQPAPPAEPAAPQK